ncbi:MAG: RNA-binding protein [Verrucomicrobiota bacterium]
MGSRLYVGNLSYDTSEDDLQQQFEKSGTVRNCNIILDKFTNRSRGFAFVEMGTDDEAKQAIEDNNGVDLQGRALVVNEARPRDDRPRGGGGGGGYGGGGGGGDRRGGGRDRGDRGRRRDNDW